MRNPRYRICTDAYAGYEVQWKRWYWPFWTSTGVGGRLTNTFATVEKAEEFARKGTGESVVKYL